MGSRRRTSDASAANGARRLSRRALFAITLLVALVLGGVVAVLLDSAPSPVDATTASPAEPPLAPDTTNPVPSSRTDVKMGVFRQTDPEQVAEFERWLGRDMELVVDFSARDTWEQIADPQYLLDEWEGTPYRLVLGVAMLPADPSATLAAGAAGEYDAYYTELGENLVDGGHADAILRVGWEFNLEGSRWFTDDPSEFTSYWTRIVEAMRAVEGQEFEFDWTVNNGPSAADATLYWPGDDVVDYVGLDVYDVTGRTYPYPEECDEACRRGRQDEAWGGYIYGGERGLEFWSAFADEHDKPLSVPEWGLWDRPDGTGGGDNPSFVRRMHAFLHDTRNNVAYHAYFEYDSESSGDHSVSRAFPEAGQVFRELFGPG